MHVIKVYSTFFALLPTIWVSNYIKYQMSWYQKRLKLKKKNIKIKLFKRGKFNIVNNNFICCAIQIPKFKIENNMYKNFAIYSNETLSLSLFKSNFFHWRNSQKFESIRKCLSGTEEQQIPSLKEQKYKMYIPTELKEENWLAYFNDRKILLLMYANTVINNLVMYTGISTICTETKLNLYTTYDEPYK